MRVLSTTACVFDSGGLFPGTIDEECPRIGGRWLQLRMCTNRETIDR
jgi:hypothetical protein